MGPTRRVGLTAVALCVSAGLALAGLALSGLDLAGAGGGRAGSDLPELPGVDERHDALYDGDGCLRTAVDERDCSVTAPELDALLAGGDESDVRHLAGFTGSRWTDEPTAGRPVVLEETVAMTFEPTVGVRGLVRNEGTDTVGAIEVSAVLRGPGGEELAVLTGPAAVGTVRRGEPVPFELSGPAVTVPIASVDWSATALTAPGSMRRLEWQPYWDQPAGERDPVQNYLYEESGTGPHPHVTFGSVRNVGTRAAAGVSVVAGWIDADGRLVALTSTPVAGPDGRPAATLPAGSAADAVLVDAGVPIGAEALVWASGS